MNFDVNDILRERVKRVMTALEGCCRGDTRPHDWFMQAAGGNWSNPDDYWTVIEGVKKALRDERGIELVADRGTGYHLATVQEQVAQLPRSRMLAASRDLSKGIRTLDVIPQEEMDEGQQFLAAEQTKIMRNGRRDIRKRLKEQRTILQTAKKQGKKMTRKEKNAQVKKEREAYERRVARGVNAPQPSAIV